MLAWSLVPGSVQCTAVLCLMAWGEALVSPWFLSCFGVHHGLDDSQFTWDHALRKWAFLFAHFANVALLMPIFSYAYMYIHLMIILWCCTVYCVLELRKLIFKKDAVFINNMSWISGAYEYLLVCLEASACMLLHFICVLSHYNLFHKNCGCGSQISVLHLYNFVSDKPCKIYG